MEIKMQLAQTHLGPFRNENGNAQVQMAQPNKHLISILVIRFTSFFFPKKTE